MLFISSGPEGKSYLVDAETSNVLRTYKSDPAHSKAAAVFVERSNSIYVAERKNCIFTFNLAHAQAVQKSFSSENMTCLAVSPCNNFIVGGSAETGCIFVWSLHGGELFRLLKSHLKNVRHIAFSPDGAYFASASADTTCKIWRTSEAFSSDINANVNPVTTFTVHTLSVEACGFLQESSLLATCSLDRSVRVFDVTTGAQIFSVNTPVQLVMLRVLNPSTLFCGGADGSLLLIPLRNKAAAQNQNVSAIGGEGSVEAAVSATVASTANQKLAATLAEAATQAYTIVSPFTEGHNGPIVAAWPISATKLMVASQDGNLSEWNFDLTNGGLRLVRNVLMYRKGITSIANVPRVAAQAVATKTVRYSQLAKYPNDSGVVLMQNNAEASKVLDEATDLKRRRVEGLREQLAAAQAAEAKLLDLESMLVAKAGKLGITV
eukprot:GILI01020631.1.p1 GENE.GILI01020631.1~~GILI01020631.1.p1  ORF type:complete len:444 (-),score=96.16 GILI01020631.1:80-1384(-)